MCVSQNTPSVFELSLVNEKFEIYQWKADKWVNHDAKGYKHLE